MRAYLGGELVADTTHPLLVWEKPYYPAYYFPLADVRIELLEEDGGVVALAEPRRRRHVHRDGRAARRPGARRSATTTPRSRSCAS